MRWPNYVLLIFLLFVAVSSPLAKEIIPVMTGSIEGFITDENRVPIPRARIQAFDVMRGEMHNAISERNGAYRLLELAGGRYSLSVQARGYASTWIPTVIVEDGRPSYQDVQLIREPTVIPTPTRAAGLY